jgi:hypothetical protein
MPTPTTHLLEIDALRKIFWEYGRQVMHGDVSESMVKEMRCRISKICAQLDFFDKKALIQEETVVILAKNAPDLPLEPHEFKKA